MNSSTSCCPGFSRSHASAASLRIAFVATRLAMACGERAGSSAEALISASTCRAALTSLSVRWSLNFGRQSRQY